MVACFLSIFSRTNLFPVKKIERNQKMIVKINSYYFSYKKKLFDLSFSFFGLFFGWPFLFLISFLIFLKSGFPIFYVQKRMGKNNKIFNMYKFRTMKVFAEKENNKYSILNQAPWPMFKIFDDPRFVGDGKFLSKSGLDELPQLFNILKGEMSVVGPRPLPEKEANELVGIDPEFTFRFLVKPGIFSEWGLSENRHKSLKIWKSLDKKTVLNGGWFYDLKLIGNTLWNHLRKV